MKVSMLININIFAEFYLYFNKNGECLINIVSKLKKLHWNKIIITIHNNWHGELGGTLVPIPIEFYMIMPRYLFLC